MPSLPFFSPNREIRDLTPEARRDAPGSFVSLADGVTHYELAGPPQGEAVVLVHGFSMPYYLWDHTFEPLAQAGFRVLRYDLFGRGWSDRPDAVYDVDLYDRQLCGLIEALGMRTPVHLVGSSMGGVIVTQFTARHPQQVARLALIDPAGLLDRMPFPMSLLQSRFLGGWLMEHFGDRALTSGLRADVLDEATFEEYARPYLDQMQFRGFKRALLSTLQSGVLHGQDEAFACVGRQERPVLLVWGRDDRTIPFAISARVRAHLPRAEFVVIENAGHIPHYERPEVINPLLASFLGASAG